MKDQDSCVRQTPQSQQEQHTHEDSSRQSFFTTGQAADLLGVHPQTIRRWLKQGRFTNYGINREGWGRLSEKEVREAQKNGLPPIGGVQC